MFVAPVVVVAVLLSTASAATSQSAAPEHHEFALYKWQDRIGAEEATVSKDARGTEIRSAFSFRDRGTSVPLAATLRLDSAGTPRRYQIWGKTSRGTSVDDLVERSGTTLVVTQRGVTRRMAAPARYFMGSSYAPVAMIEALLHYWNTNGQPTRLPVIPVGEVTIERRGEDVVTDDDGTERRLERYSIAGLQWGRESVWLNETGQLAAVKGVDAEFDHFEATGSRFSEALGNLVAKAGEDGMAALAEAASRLRRDSTGDTVAYVGARLVDATGAPPVDDAVVVTRGDRIAAVGPRSRVAVPENAHVVDVTGKTILPGLWDMHAHFEQVEWGPLYLAAGVTTVRDCGNELDFLRGVRSAIAAGRGIGPRILMACIIDGEGPFSLGKLRLRSDQQIPGIIAEFDSAGCSQVKVYSNLDPQLIAPLARAAHAAGMTVTGHVPNGIGALGAIDAGFDQINHLSFVMRAFLAPGVDPAKSLTRSESQKAYDELDLDSPESRRIAAKLAAKPTVVDPTLALSELGWRTHEELVRVEPGLSKLPGAIAGAYAGMGATPENVVRGRQRLEKNLALLGMLHRAGVPIVTGTDQAVPGHSEAREIELYVQAGFTPMEAIQAATLVPARVMKLDRESGTIEPGKRADLIIVDGDPLTDIHALRRVVTVVAAGTSFDPKQLWESVGFKP